MGIRHWLRKKRAEQAEDGEEDRAPSGSIISAIFGREAPTLHALGEFDQTTYPGELQDLLRRREDVAEELREMDLTTRQARVDAIPRLQQMLRTYPHPLAYETLIHAYVDAGRWDEARGAAFAARERRTQVLRSPYSEIRNEVDRLKEWSPEEVEAVRKEREGVVPPTQPSRPSVAAEPPANTAPPAPVAVSAQAAAVQPVSLASADADPAQPATTPVDAEPAFVSEPDSVAVAPADADSSASTESVAVLDAESTALADSTDAMLADEAEPDDASAESAGTAESVGGAARPGGRGPSSQRKKRK